MKIAMIGQKGIPALYGGVERHVEELSIHLVSLGHFVFAYTRPWYEKESKIKNQKLKIYKGVNLISLPSIYTKHLDAITHTLFASIHALFQNYDIIHYHGIGPSLLSWIPRFLKPKTKVIVTFHSRDTKHQKWGWFARLILTSGEWMSCKIPHQTITVSKALQDYCKKRYGKETIYIPNGITTQDNTFSKIDNLSLEEFNLEEKKYILMVSRLVRHKGVHYLIEAYKNLDPKLQANYKLVIVGGSVFTDDYVKFLKEKAKGNENIIFTGSQSGKILETLFKGAYLFVLPSEDEGLSVAILEAMNYGIPVLASDISGNMELVENYGFYFKNKDANDLTRKLRYLIEHPEVLKIKAKNAKRFVLENYNWLRISERIEKIYAGVLIRKELIDWAKETIAVKTKLIESIL